MPPKVERLHPKPDEDKLRDDIERGEKAKRLLNKAISPDIHDNPTLNEALEHMRLTAIARWESATDAETREYQWQVVQSIRALRKLLDADIAKGSQAVKELDALKNPPKADRLYTP
jgi:hypothetical protein